LVAQRVREYLATQCLDLFDEASQTILSSSTHTPLAFSILTALAGGADRLVAKVVMKLPGARLEAVLPLTIPDYNKTFKDDASQREFAELLGLSRAPVFLRTRNLRDEFSASAVDEARREAYYKVGTYVVDHCDVLIAVWNGQPAGGRGGTAEIVSYALRQLRPVVIISTEPSIQTEVKVGHGLSASPVEQIEVFNAFSISDAKLNSHVQERYDKLFGNELGKNIPPAAKETVLNKLLPSYVRASEIAKRNQRVYRRAALFTYLLSVVAVALIAVGILLPRVSHYAFLAEFVVLSTILTLVIRANQMKVHRWWIECRFLAERIRSSIFFAVCGIEASPIDIPPYMRTAHRPDDWMVRTFHEIWNGLPSLTSCQGGSCTPYSEYVEEMWIRKQIKYHRDTSIDNRRLGRRLELGGIAIFSVAMIAAFVHFGAFLPGRVLLSSTWGKAISLAAIVLPAAGAAIGGIRSHREYSRIEKRSSNMVQVLSDLLSAFRKSSNVEDLVTLLRQTEELMLRETQDWLMFMRFTDLKVGEGI
jgi:hypothetical protein